MSSTRVRYWLFAAVVTLLLTACGSDDDGNEPGSQGRSTTTTSARSLAVDWHGEFETPLPNGWIIRSCEGARLNVCVYDGTDLLGDIELIPGYPLGDRVGTDPQAAARRLAEDMVDEFRRDRAEGCAQFTFKPERVSNVTIGTKPGARGGFSVTDKAGRVVERVVNFYLVEGDTFAIVNIDAYVTEGGCLGPTEYDPTFSPSELGELEPHLNKILAETPTTADGTKTGS